VIAALLLALLAQHPIPDAPVKRGTLSFEGRATLGDFVGTTDSVRGAMQGGPDLAAVTGWVEAPVASLRTGNGKRDKDLRKSMEVEQHPLMRFDLEGVTPGDTLGDTVAVSLHGVLTIHGVKQGVVLPAQVWRGDGGLRLRADFRMNVKDYQVGGLTKMLGILKMNEHIVVHVDVTFGP
jgi:polyisoprenoid-binding protein YceI